MEKRFVMTAFGNDRPGIVAGVTQVIYENGCNLEDSTMTRLSDEFAVILLFSGSGEDLEERLLRDCRRLEIEKGISAFLRPIEDEKVEEKGKFSVHSVHVEGLDQAGIVYKVSQHFANKGVNIVNLHSARIISPESGTAIYTMEIQVEVPEDISLDNLDEGLAKIGDELNLEITVE